MGSSCWKGFPTGALTKEKEEREKEWWFLGRDYWGGCDTKGSAWADGRSEMTR